MACQRTVDLVDNDTDVDSGGELVITELLPTALTLLRRRERNGHAACRAARSPSTLSDGRGVATFTYRVRDVDGGVSEPATVTVNGPPANQPPIATNQSISVTVGTSASVDLQVSDPDGQPLSIVDATFSDPSGVVTGRSGLQLTVLASTPGTFVVTYQVTDGEATSPPATVTVTASIPTTTTTRRPP